MLVIVALIAVFIAVVAAARIVIERTVLHHGDERDLVRPSAPARPVERVSSR